MGKLTITLFKIALWMLLLYFYLEYFSFLFILSFFDAFLDDF